jgi:hypothetical protein
MIAMNLIRRTFTATAIFVVAAAVVPANTLTVSGFYSSPQTVTSLNSNSCLNTTTPGPTTGDANCTQTDWLGASSNNNTPYASIAIGQFNSALGTLTGVSIDVMGALESTVTFTNGATPTTVTSYVTSFNLAALALNATAPYSPLQTDGSGTPCLQDFTFQSQTFCETGVNQTIAGIPANTYAPGTTIGPATYDYFVDSGSVALSSIAGWAGNGNIIVPVEGIVQTITNETGGNFTTTQVTDAVAELTVTYTYTPPFTGVPEPATLFLMGSALVGVGLLRKRSKS